MNDRSFTPAGGAVQVGKSKHGINLHRGDLHLPPHAMSHWQRQASKHPEAQKDVNSGRFPWFARDRDVTVHQMESYIRKI